MVTIHAFFLRGNMSNATLDPAAIDDHIQMLLDKQFAITAAANELKALLDADGHAWPKEELDKFVAWDKDYVALEEEIQARLQLNKMTREQEAGRGRQTEPDAPQPQMSADTTPDVRRTLPAQPIDSARSGRGGFRNFGEFARAVKAGSGPTPVIDQRFQLMTAPTATGNTGVGAEGGFVVPVDFRETIMKQVYAEDSLVSLTDQQTTSSNRYTQPADEVTPWSTTGPRAYWVGEGAQITQSKPSLKQLTVDLGKLACLVPVTEEQLEDGPSITNYLNTKVPDKFAAAIDQAIIAGTGAAQPLGLMSSPDLISVAKETVPAAQAADTIWHANIDKMYNRLFDQFRPRGVWLANQDCEPELMNMYFGILNAARSDYVGGQATYLPAGAQSAQPYSTLKARRVYFNQSCKTLGDAGDIWFWDPQSYITVTKSAGTRLDTSIHMFFDYDVTAFRFIFRFGGRPKWASVITARNGSQTYSSTVRLAERA